MVIECNCQHKQLRPVSTFIHVPLKDGCYTNFELFQCGTCGQMIGFPYSNYQMAMEENTWIKELVENMYGSQPV
jgi:hypothetical protein